MDYVEIDKNAVKCYNAIYGENYEPQDITTWDKQIEVDLVFHGSPCTDFSLAGKQAGGDLGSGTSSSLMYETIRIVGKLRPKYVLWENVPNVLTEKHKHNFDKYLNTLEALGYTNYYKKLNAKDYGVPQNRIRVFVISILGEHEPYVFPKEEISNIRLKDILETNVDEKYYLSEEKIQSIANWKAFQKPFERVLGANSICPTLTARGAGEEHSGMILLDENLENTTNLQNKVKEYKNYVSWEDTKGRINTQDWRAFKENCVSGTVPAMERGIPKVLLKGNPNRIRKLTEKECFRLMGFTDIDFENAKSSGASRTQLYRAAGNSIVVNVLESVFKQLF